MFFFAILPLFFGITKTKFVLINQVDYIPLRLGVCEIFGV